LVRKTPEFLPKVFVNCTSILAGVIIASKLHLRTEDGNISGKMSACRI
jgi:hypothetical protein